MARRRATAVVGGRGRNEFIMGLGRLKGGIAAALGLWAVALALWAVRQYAPAAPGPRAVTMGAAAVEQP